MSCVTYSGLLLMSLCHQMSLVLMVTDDTLALHARDKTQGFTAILNNTVPAQSSRLITILNNTDPAQSSHQTTILNNTDPAHAPRFTTILNNTEPVFTPAFSSRLTPILNNTGPAVIGSNVTFHAVLYGCNDTDGRFRLTYIWTNNAHRTTNKWKTTGGCSSQITLVFSGNDAGLYTMFVAVYDGGQWSVDWDTVLCLTDASVDLGRATTIFNLTDELNGALAVTQVKRVVHPPHVYLTNTPVSFEVVISDQMTDVSFEYTWTRNGTVVGVGHLPRYTYTFETAGWYYFQVHVNMSSNDTRMANSRRNGVFEKHFLLKDAVSTLVYSGNTTFPVGTLLEANISWNGSAPFHVSWNVTGAGRAGRSQTMLVSQPTASLAVPLYQVGDYILNIHIGNDLSDCSRRVSFTVYKPARAASGPPFSIVLLCAVTGVAAIVMTAIAYRRDRHLKHSHLEVADFHFHFTPSSSVGHYVSSLRHKWRHLWNAPSSRRDNIRMDSYDRL